VELSRPSSAAYSIRSECTYRERLRTRKNRLAAVTKKRQRNTISMAKPDPRTGDMKKEENPSDVRLNVIVRIYALALLLATFVSALHAGLLFGLADLLVLFREYVQPILAKRPADILLVMAAISALFAAHIIEAALWAAFFLKSGRLASFADAWYFAGVSTTTLGYGDVVLEKPWRSLGPISAINGLLTFGCSTAFFFLVLQSIWQHPP
jgi:Ion channel